MKNMEAQTVGRILTNEFITRYGVPEILHTDQGGNFESIVIKELCRYNKNQDYTVPPPIRRND